MTSGVRSPTNKENSVCKVSGCVMGGREGRVR